MSDTQTITASALAALTGFSERELRGLQIAGFIPKATAGNYPLTESVQGCFSAYKQKLSEGLPSLFESMKQCHEAIGIPLATLKLARDQSGVFKHHRIPLAPLLRWIFSRDESEIDWGTALKEFQAKREKLKLEKEKGETLDKGEIKTGLAKGMSLLFSGLDRLASVELPPALKGMSEAQIQQRLKEATEKLREQLKTELERLVKA